MGMIRDKKLLRKIYNAADVFVAPSIQEAFGRTLIEAMACGVPVVAFDNSGPQDIVLHQETGYLALPFSSQSLAEGINWLAESNDYQTISDKARDRAEKMFSIQLIAQRYVEYYQKINENSLGRIK
jgi:glycosyltransferase involved in cell wall biosynthesis